MLLAVVKGIPLNYDALLIGANYSRAVKVLLQMLKLIWRLEIKRDYLCCLCLHKPKVKRRSEDNSCDFIAYVLLYSVCCIKLQKMSCSGFCLLGFFPWGSQSREYVLSAIYVGFSQFSRPNFTELTAIGLSSVTSHVYVMQFLRKKHLLIT